MRFIENLIKKESLVAIFVLGVLFSLVKAPCVGALYLSILNMLIRDGGAYGMLYLSVYNIGVVFPEDIFVNGKGALKIVKRTI